MVMALVGYIPTLQRELIYFSIQWSTTLGPAKGQTLEYQYRTQKSAELSIILHTH